MYLLEAYRFIINKEINNDPMPINQVSGSDDRYQFNDCKSLSGQNEKNLGGGPKTASGGAIVTARDLAHLLGKMNATTCIIPIAPLFCWHLQMCLSQALNINNHRITRQC